MSLLSRYYIKEKLQKRMIENAIQSKKLQEEEIDDMYKQVAEIKDDIVAANEETNKAVYGFFCMQGLLLARA